MTIENFFSKVLTIGEPLVLENNWKKLVFKEKQFPSYGTVEMGLIFNVIYNENSGLFFCTLYLSDDEINYIIDNTDESDLRASLEKETPQLFYTEEKYLQTINSMEGVAFLPVHLKVFER